MFWKSLLALPLLLSSSLGTNELSQSDDSVHLRAAHTSQSSALADFSSFRPEAIYHRAWQRINDDYVDNTYNNQSWPRWEHRYDGKMKDLTDAHKAIETMLASLGDRYTRFLDKDAFADEKSQIDAKLFGIGIQISIDDKHHLIIFNAYPDTPAEKAGLKPADEILDIDGKPTKGLTVEEAAKMIRGEVNSEVVLTLHRAGKERMKIGVRRAEISIHAVQTATMLSNEVGYIRLSSFISQQATDEMRDAISKLSDAKGMILDLRDNPGGLLSNAIEISNMFLDMGAIVSTVDRDGFRSTTHADGKAICRQPLVVLINSGSASAAEITSGALRDNDRALLVGEKSYGKGLVQGINHLPDGSGLNITIAHYLTPKDTDINKKGITPDFPVNVSAKDLKDGKGPWWLDPALPKAKRAPDDFKDLQLKKAFDVVKTNFTTPSVAIGTH
jgi:carboxyl-terminal processing protease